jgi:hypothetical protein
MKQLMVNGSLIHLLSLARRLLSNRLFFPSRGATKCRRAVRAACMPHTTGIPPTASSTPSRYVQKIHHPPASVRSKLSKFVISASLNCLISCADVITISVSRAFVKFSFREEAQTILLALTTGAGPLPKMALNELQVLSQLEAMQVSNTVTS